MKQTLVYIPHFLFEGPLFWSWVVAGLAILAFLCWRFGKKEALSFLPVYVVIGLLIRFVLPALEVTDISATDPPNEEPAGLAIRGYGLMMLLALVAGLGLTMIRAKKIGIHPDRILSFAFWLVISGIVGARLFYVIQKWDQFSDAGSLWQLLGAIANMTQGGLVVYGSIIGGVIGGGLYLWRTGLPVFRVADLSAPGMALGLAIGRIGCLLNGCCYGGTCEVEQIALHFPAGSPPYLRQLETGELLGITPRPVNPQPQPARQRIAQTVDADSLAARHGIASGESYRVDFPADKVFRAIKVRQLNFDANVLVDSDGKNIAIPISELPSVSIGVYPAQLISALNAALLAAVLWFYFPFRRRDGHVFALMLILYAITRFLLEFIRTDELGVFGTPFTISQWVSMLMMVVGFAMFALLNRYSPARPAATE